MGLVAAEVMDRQPQLYRTALSSHSAPPGGPSDHAPLARPSAKRAASRHQTGCAARLVESQRDEPPCFPPLETDDIGESEP